MKMFADLEKLMGQEGFVSDSYNEGMDTDKNTLRRYKKGEIVCNLERVDNLKETTSLSVACANINDTLCNLNSDCGKDCKIDIDCGPVFDACQRKRVCRNPSYKFFNDCPNPSSNIDDIDFVFPGCKCVNNQCASK